ncbi:MAG: hypothetical protein QXR17_04840 [Candidatus Bathyarchaeia archaeon]|nr:hypothetical protein [Candidatus Bathyarchaeota archaeon]
MKTENNITIHVKYCDLEKTFTGNINEVWLAVNKFFSELIPAFEMAKALTLKMDLSELVEACKGIVGFIENKPYLLVSKVKLTDNETLAIHLLAAYVGHKLGVLNTDSMSREELQSRLGKSGKITSTRLGELIKMGIVEKNPDGDYRLTGFGVVQMQREWLPRIRSKLRL